MGNWLGFSNRFRAGPSLTMAIGVTLLVISMLLSDIPTMISSLTWPSVFGEITSRRLVSQRFEEYDGDYYIKTEGYLKYSYLVEGIEYSGVAVNALEEISCPESTARKYPKGREVEVFYNPRTPPRLSLSQGLFFLERLSVCCLG